jgi:dienelactone hydrolase
MTGTDDIAVSQRATIRIPTRSGEEIEAWVYRPQSTGPHPAIVLAHGFAAVKAGGLAAFAERFCREGFTAVAFDYRQWGGSSGEPRDEASVSRQCEDYRTVIGWAVGDPEIDASQVFIWGTSFSGLHAVELAATDTRLRGAIAQTPLVDGLARAMMGRPIGSLRVLGAALLDRVGSLVGRSPWYIPAGVAPGEFGAVASATAVAGLNIIRPKDGSEWHNRVAARSMLGIPAHRPVRKAAEIRCPILVIVDKDDDIIPVSAALRVAERAPQGELFQSHGGHYGVYEGGEDYPRVIDAEVEFLHRHAQVRPQSESVATSG